MNCTNSRCPYYIPYYANEQKSWFRSTFNQQGECAKNYCVRKKQAIKEGEEITCLQLF